MTRQPEAENALPAFVQLHPELTPYWRNVLRPMLSGIRDDGALTTFLNRQIELWEIESGVTSRQPTSPERAHNHEHAAHIIALLKDTLAALVLRIRARINAAEAVLAVAS